MARTESERHLKRTHVTDNTRCTVRYPVNGSAHSLSLPIFKQQNVTLFVSV